jgi:hypothetical protein
VSGAVVSAGGESVGNGVVESVAGTLEEDVPGAGESDSVGSWSGESAVGEESVDEPSVGVGTGAGADVVVPGCDVVKVAIAESVFVGDVSGDVPVAGEPDVPGDPGGSVTGSVMKLSVGCPESSAGSSASAPSAPCNVPSAYRWAAVMTFVT